MSMVLRTVLALLLAVALPLQGWAAATMLHCGPAHDRPAVGQFAADAHAAHGHAGKAHAGHDHAGHDHAGHDHVGHDHAGHDRVGHDHVGQAHAAQGLGHHGHASGDEGGGAALGALGHPVADAAAAGLDAPQGKCSACANCCSALAIPTTPPTLVEPHPDAVRFVVAPGGFAPVDLSGLKRPPRTRLA
jgi:hypothetical protein